MHDADGHGTFLSRGRRLAAQDAAALPMSQHGRFHHRVAKDAVERPLVWRHEIGAMHHNLFAAELRGVAWHCTRHTHELILEEDTRCGPILEIEAHLNRHVARSAAWAEAADLRVGEMRGRLVDLAEAAHDCVRLQIVKVHTLHNYRGRRIGRCSIRGHGSDLDRLVVEVTRFHIGELLTIS